MTDTLSTTATTEPVRAQDDLFRHINGEWLRTATIPDDKPSAGAFEDLRDESEAAVRDIITGLSSESGELSPEQAKIAHLYASFMDVDRVEALGPTPLQPHLDAVDAVASITDFLSLVGNFGRNNISGLIGFGSEADPGDPQRVVMFLGQSGLGLPNEEYYREDSYAKIRDQYLEHATTSLELAGFSDAAEQAATVLALETAIAAAHWDKVRTRDMRQMYNLMSYEELRASAPAVDWDAFWRGTGIEASKYAEVVNSQPSFFTDLGALLSEDRLPQWQSWARWKIVSSLSPYLSDVFVNERFRFYGTVLSGTPTIKERWKRGVDLVEGALGEAVGKVYVERHFSPRAKERMDELVANLIKAYGESIRNLEWMTEDTRTKALDKLSKFRPKIGFPAQWRDYSGYEVDPTDLVGNVVRSATFDLDYQMSKIGQPTDPDEWLMTPQTVNAYYHPLRNEIVFPAAILQPPFFDEFANDATNYGGIGAVIGHEIGHGFDDQGSTCDGDGKLINWWTDADRSAFEERTGALIAQYNALAPQQTPDTYVNGELTIGENIGDLGGLGISLKALTLAHGGKISDDELRELFTAWATVWRTTSRDEHMLRRLALDPHSPPEFRCNQVVRNLDDFHRVFGVTEDDAMWLAPADRVRIW